MRADNRALRSAMDVLNKEVSGGDGGGGGLLLRVVDW
jgi:hypothetical protein